MKIRTILAGIAALGLLAHSASAVVSFEPITWGSGGDTLGWYVTGETHPVSLTSPAVGGNPSGFLQAAFGGDPAFQSASIVLDSGSYFGNYWADHVAGVRFQFLGFPGTPQSFFFASASGTIWSYDIVTVNRNWNNNSFYAAFNENNYTKIAGSQTLQQALTEVALVGFSVSHLDVDPFTYGIDNWRLVHAIPEPGSMAMALTALVSALATFRRRLFGGAAEDGAQPALA